MNILTDTNHASKDGESILDFPAPLLHAIYLQDCLSGQPQAVVEPKTFKEFIVLVFGAMNPMTLRKSLGVGRDGQLLEHVLVWQMEFYHAVMQVLPVNIHTSVDVGAVFGSNGYLDFYVNDKHN
ncbi:2886_t:CDS:1 [Paraglomus brasilianum]|uniref:2886_t:CDS:1 n=1 Tax=Paraglomus brasilianum TaxID=144538 RepID=A0A9N9DMW5_9GLOM|nr:2886_t:CDS:1 [Paraglomus brasilianum]